MDPIEKISLGIELSIRKKFDTETSFKIIGLLFRNSMFNFIGNDPNGRENIYRTIKDFTNQTCSELSTLIDHFDEGGTFEEYAQKMQTGADEYQIHRSKP